jgi:glycosyltransferase involved in cell wall biosynthesis
MTRWLYIKNGDVVDQLNALGECPQTVPEGGPEAFIGDFLRYTCGQQVFLLSCFNRKAYLSNGRVTALVLQTVGRLTRFRLFKFFLLIYQVINAFFRIAVYRPHQIICGSSGAMLWLTCLVSKLLNVPWVHSRHNRVTDPQASMRAKIVESIDGYCIRRAHAVICHGPYLKQELLDIGIKRSKIHEFDVGFNDFLRQASQSTPTPEILPCIAQPFVLYIGRMEAYKGIFDILSALEDKLRENPATRLVYAGSGKDLPQLRDAVAGKGLCGQVAILGKLGRQEISVLLRSAKILVVATRSEFPEGRCMAAMEGLALGVPVVAPDFGPFPYLITPGVNGLLYRTDCVEDLRENLASLLDNEAFYRKIAQGVAETRHKIINPSLSFSQAAQRAFEEG